MGLIMNHKIAKFHFSCGHNIVELKPNIYEHCDSDSPIGSINVQIYERLYDSEIEDKEGYTEKLAFRETECFSIQSDQLKCFINELIEIDEFFDSAEKVLKSKNKTKKKIKKKKDKTKIKKKK